MQLDLALSQVKRVEREVRIAKQMIARAIESTEQPREGTSNGNEEAAEHDHRLVEVA